jgi:hypothetical protein
MGATLLARNQFHTHPHPQTHIAHVHERHPLSTLPRLPRQELLPEKRFLTFPPLVRADGRAGPECQPWAPPRARARGRRAAPRQAVAVGGPSDRPPRARARIAPTRRRPTHARPPQAKAVGSAPLAERLRRLRPAVHVFGHSHFAWDARMGATRYVQAPLCYPGERARRGRSIRIGAAAAQWRQRQEAELCAAGVASTGRAADVDAGGRGQGGGCSTCGSTSSSGSSSGSSSSGSSSRGEAVPASAGGGFTTPAEGGDWEGRLPALLYTARFSSGGGSHEWSAQWAPSLEGMWSDYYASNPRQPENTELAPWVAARFERRRRRLAGSRSLSSGSETEAE